MILHYSPDQQLVAVTCQEKQRPIVSKQIQMLAVSFKLTKQGGRCPVRVTKGGASKQPNQAAVVHMRSRQNAPSAPWPWPLIQITLSCVCVSMLIYTRAILLLLCYPQGSRVRGLKSVVEEMGKKERWRSLTFLHFCGLSVKITAATFSRCADSFSAQSCSSKGYRGTESWSTWNMRPRSLQDTEDDKATSH